MYGASKYTGKNNRRCEMKIFNIHRIVGHTGKLSGAAARTGSFKEIENISNK